MLKNNYGTKVNTFDISLMSHLMYRSIIIHFILHVLLRVYFKKCLKSDKDESYNTPGA